MAHDIILIGIGLIIGFLSGLFGVGGSSIATPVLRLIDIPRMIALASPLPVSLPTAVVGGITYWKKGLVNTKAVFWTALGGVPTVALGAYLTTVVPGRVLMALTGAFVMAVGIRVLSTRENKENKNETQTSSLTPIGNRWLFLIVGMITGVFSGLLANGGGFLLLPAYLLIFRFSPQEAAATSLVAVAFLALPGTWTHFVLGHIDWKIAGLMAIGVIPSTYAGARIGLSLDQKKARRLFGLFLLLFGLFFLTRTLYRAEHFGWY
ncbi:MAG: sulfite exporter TauE/SafE family protein [Candidatus Omnitrophota bacterium]